MDNYTHDTFDLSKDCEFKKAKSLAYHLDQASKFSKQTKLTVFIYEQIPIAKIDWISNEYNETKEVITKIK